MNCVVCGQPITRDEKVWVCPEGLRHITCPPPAGTPDCNCHSRALLEGTRHGLNCPYGKRLAQQFVAEQERKRTPPVDVPGLAETSE